MEKLRLPTFKGLSDPSTHVTSFNIAMRRANLTDEDKDAAFCQLFVETLEGPALTLFTGLRENSVDCFHDLSTAFLKNYIMFTNQEGIKFCHETHGFQKFSRDPVLICF
ncbi:hypothetical protein Bca4012_044084 [Brassica carinata]